MTISLNLFRYKNYASYKKTLKKLYCTNVLEICNHTVELWNCTLVFSNIRILRYFGYVIRCFTFTPFDHRCFKIFYFIIINLLHFYIQNPNFSCICDTCNFIFCGNWASIYYLRIHKWNKFYRIFVSYVVILFGLIPLITYFIGII